MADTTSNDSNDLTSISAQSTDEIEEAPNPNGPADPAATDSSGFDDESEAVESRTYQDDLDGDDDATDPFANEATEDPTDILQIPADEYKDGMDGIALDDLERGNEDMRERVEDLDEGDDNPASTA